MRKVNKSYISKIKKEYLIIAVVVGIAIMLFSKNSSLKKTEVSSASNRLSLWDFEESTDSETNKYVEYVSNNIKICLEKMEGVGNVEVFLNIKTDTDSYMGNDSFSVEGIMVVAEGADNPIVVKDIMEACEALFSLEAHKIKIVRMKEEY